jgi:hypothetical protein
MKWLLRKLFTNLFYKEPIPKIRNKGLAAAINKLSKQKDNKYAVEQALEILAKKYKSKRFSTYIFFYKIFENNPNKLWTRTGFMHCNQQNFLLRLLLVKSGKVEDSEIKFGYSMIWYMSLHQYLKIKVGDIYLAADPWNYSRGAALGKYASGFGMKSL